MDQIGDKVIQFIKKYRYAVLIVLLGIILMMLPDGTGDAKAPTEQTEIQQNEELDIEQKLSTILSQVQGAGQVQVMLTEAYGEETVYQLDTDISTDDTGSTSRNTTVIVTDEARNEAGLIQQVNPPAFLGAIIVCQGADSPTVRLEIVEAVCAVTGLGADRISVLKMK